MAQNSFRSRLPTKPSRTPPRVATTLVAPGTAYSELKIYARDLQEYGLEKLAKETVLQFANGETHEALAGKVFDRSTSSPRAPASNEQIDYNKAQTQNQYLVTLRTHDEYDEPSEVLPLTACVNDTVLAALESYTSLVSSVAFDFKADAWTLRVAPEDAPLPIGWATGKDVAPYDLVNLPPGVPFQKEEQNKVLFAVGGKAMKKLCKVHKLDYFKQLIVRYLEHDFKNHHSNVEECHVLFGFSNYVHFSYHQDSKDLTSGSAVKLSFIFNLSPGRSSMSVAGSQDYVYKFPGACSAFYSDLFHCSGDAEMRTVKVAFFVTLSEKASSSVVDLAAEEEKPRMEDQDKPASSLVLLPAVLPPSGEQKSEQEHGGVTGV